MRLSGIVELIQTRLKEAPNGIFSDLRPGTEDGIPIIPCISPAEIVNPEKLTLYLLPDYVEYKLDGKTGRRSIKSATPVKILSYFLSVKFEDLDSDNLDVTSWNEAKRVINFKEGLDVFLLGGDYYDAGLVISTFEPVLPAEEELKRRVYIAGTQIGFTDRCMLEQSSTPES